MGFARADLVHLFLGVFFARDYNIVLYSNLAALDIFANQNRPEVEKQIDVQGVGGGAES